MSGVKYLYKKIFCSNGARPLGTRAKVLWRTEPLGTRAGALRCARLLGTGGAALLLMGSIALHAGEVPHIGYLYPAGGVPGSTFTMKVGGQHLKNTIGIYVSGGKISAEVTDYTFELDRRMGNRAKNMKDKMDAAMEEEKDPFIRAQIQNQIDKAADIMMMAESERKEMRKNKAEYAKKQFNPQLADTLTLEVEIGVDVKPGRYDLRVVTTNGISNHLVFDVSELKEVSESEPNNDVSDTVGSAPALPLMLNGQIMPGDTDCFSFYAEKDDDLVFRVQARSLVPYLADAVPGWFQAILTLYDTKGHELAYVDDFRFDPDPVMIYRVPADGEYVLEIRDSIYRGRRDFVYRIAMGKLPFIDHIFPLGGRENSKTPVQLYGVNLPQKKLMLKTGGSAPDIMDVAVGRGSKHSNSRPFAVDLLPEKFEAEPNDLPFQAQTIKENIIINGRIDKPGDADCFHFAGKKGEMLTIEVFARRLDSPLDARLVLLDPQEHIIAVSDDEVDRGEGLLTHHADSLLNIELPENGVYTIRLDNLQGKGGHAYAYRLRVGESHPDYHLRVVPSGISVPQDGTAVVTVHALRKSGFDGAIDLKLVGAPQGITMSGPSIAAGAQKAVLNISASGLEAEEMIPIRIEGTARIKERNVRREAVPADDTMQAFLYRHLVPAQELLVRITKQLPITVKAELPESGVVKVVPGGKVIISHQTVRQDGVKGNIRLSLSNAPEWVSLKKTSTGWKNSSIILAIGEKAPAGALENITINGSFFITKAKDDPTFNPVLKWRNRTKYDFTIAAVTIEVAKQNPERTSSENGNIKNP